jgi:hypothetical protein
LAAREVVAAERGEKGLIRCDTGPVKERGFERAVELKGSLSSPSFK